MAGPDGEPIPFAVTEYDARGDFRVRTVRISVNGRAFLPFLNYVFEVDAGQPPSLPGQPDVPRDPRLTDGYVSLNFSDALNFRVGQLTQPLDKRMKALAQRPQPTGR